MRAFLWIVFVFSLTASLVGFFMLASTALPYQDPTPEMLANQENAIQLWQAVMGMGALTAVLAALKLRRTKRSLD